MLVRVGENFNKLFENCTYEKPFYEISASILLMNHFSLFLFFTIHALWKNLTSKIDENYSQNYPSMDLNSIAQNSTVFVIKFTRKKHWDENEKLDGEEEGESVEKYSQYARENQASKTFSSIFFPSYFWYSQSTRVSHHLTWWWYHFLKCMCT